MAIDPFFGSALGAGAILAGGSMGSHSARKVARMQLNQQQQFAMHALRWRVEDAKRAGVHPLYALGAQLPSFQPIQVDTSSMGDAVASAGMELGRGVTEYLSRPKRGSWEAEAIRSRAEAATWEPVLIESQVDAQRAIEAKARADAAEASSRTLLNMFQYNKERNAVLDVGVAGADVVRPEVLSGKGAMQSGPPDRSFKTFDVGDGFLMDFPSGQQSGAQQAFESVEGIVPSVLVIGHNVKKYGVQWVNQAMKNMQEGAGNLGYRHRQAIIRWLREYRRSR